MTKKMSAVELLDIARKFQPTVTYTKNKAGTAIAAWKNGRWHTVAMQLITGEWGEVGDLFINGEPCNKQEDWEAQP